MSIMRAEYNLNAMILAGGKGTRLQSVVNHRPKAMAEVSGRPFVEWLLLELRAQGIRRVVFCTGYLSEVIEGYFGDGRDWDLELLYSCEPVPLGTAGAVHYALNQVNGDRFLVMNGDSYCHVDVILMKEMHTIRKARATLWLVPMNDCRRYGSVIVEDDGAIQAFQEKSPEKRGGLINAGVYLLERELVEKIPDSYPVSIETEVFPKLIGHELYGVVGNGPFIDIGTPKAYARAGMFWARKKTR